MTRLRSRARLAESGLWASRDGQTGAPQRSVFSAETGAIRDESRLFSRATKEAGGHELRGSRRDLQSRRLTLHTGDPLCGSGTPAHRHERNAVQIRAFAKSTIRQISGFDLTCHPGDAKGGTFVPSAGTRACETMQMA